MTGGTQDHMPTKARKRIPAKADENGHGDSAYTLTFPSETWRSIKALAALRGQSIRVFMRELIRREIQEAVRTEELTQRQAKGAA